MASRKITPQSRSSRANLIFPVGRIHKLLSRGLYSKRVGVSAAISLAAALEEVAARILGESIKIMHHDKKSRITTRHILYALENDISMKELFHRFVLTQAGDVQKVETPETYLIVEDEGSIPVMPARSLSYSAQKKKRRRIIASFEDKDDEE